MSIKLKTLLEGYAWERKADGSLPTLKDSIAVHEANIAESEKNISDLGYAIKQHEADNHVYDKTKLTNIYNQLSNSDQELAKKKYPKYFGFGLKRWQDSDGDGKWYEPEDLNEYGEDEFDRSSQMYGGGKSRSEGKEILDLVTRAEDMVQRLRSNMATNSVLRRDEKMGYLKAYDELLDLLSDIGFQAEME